MIATCTNQNQSYCKMIRSHFEDVYNFLGEYITLKEIIDQMTNLEMIYTHCGNHHADDATATAFIVSLKFLIDSIYGRYFNYEGFCKRVSGITLDMRKKEKNGEAIIYDIGYGKFDHHDHATQKKRPPKTINGVNDISVPYSSFGLLWQCYGKAYINLEYLVRYNEFPDPILVDKYFEEFDSINIIPIDARDNGIYNLVESNYSETIANFNAFRSTDRNISIFKVIDPNYKRISKDKVFNFACDFADRTLYGWTENILCSIYDDTWVSKILENQDKNDTILVVDRVVRPNDAIFVSNPNIRYIVYPNNRKLGCYYIRCARRSDRYDQYLFDPDQKELYGPGVTYIQGNGRLVNALSRDAAIQACRINDAMIDHSLHINPNAQFEKGSAVM